MGILKDIFGSKGEKVQPSENEAERNARTHYVSEAKEKGGRDPIPKEPPDWAKNIPNPKDYTPK